MNQFHFRQMILQQRRQARCKRRHPVFIALAGAHGNLLVVKIDILHPGPCGFGNPQTAAVQQLDDRSVDEISQTA